MCSLTTIAPLRTIVWRREARLVLWPIGGVFSLGTAGRDRPHYDRARVDAYADLDRRSSLLLKFAPVAAQFILHSERRIERALRMVLMRDWGAE